MTFSYSINNEKILIVGTECKKFNDEFAYDIIIYKFNENNTLTEIKRYINAHNKIINRIIYFSGKIFSCSLYFVLVLCNSKF